MILLDNELKMTSTSPSVGSRRGALFTINGNGFNTEDLTVIVGSATCEILSSTHTQIVAKCGQINPAGVTNVILEYEQEDETTQQVTCNSCTFNSTNDFPAVTRIESSGPYDLDNVVISIDGRNLKEGFGATPPQFTESQVRVWLRTTDSEKNNNFGVEGTVTFTSGGVDIAFANLVAGSYNIEYHVDGLGFAKTEELSTPNFTFAPVVDSAPTVMSSFAGGSHLTFTGKGFPSLSNSEVADVRVCGLPCKVVESSYTSLKCESPILNTEDVQNSTNLFSPEIITDAVVTGDDESHKEMNRIIDGDFNTHYWGSPDSNCWVQLDLGENTIIDATKLRLFPRISSDEINLIGGVLEGSTDGTEYTTLVTIDDNVVENWNTFRPDSTKNEKWQFRYLKFRGGVRDCAIAELEVTGYKYANPHRQLDDPPLRRDHVHRRVESLKRFQQSGHLQKRKDTQSDQRRPAPRNHDWRHDHYNHRRKV